MKSPPVGLCKDVWSSSWVRFNRRNFPQALHVTHCRRVMSQFYLRQPPTNRPTKTWFAGAARKSQGNVWLPSRNRFEHSCFLNPYFSNFLKSRLQAFKWIGKWVLNMSGLESWALGSPLSKLGTSHNRCGASGGQFNCRISHMGHFFFGFYNFSFCHIRRIETSQETSQELQKLPYSYTSYLENQVYRSVLTVLSVLTISTMMTISTLRIILTMMTLVTIMMSTMMTISTKMTILIMMRIAA